MNEALLKQKKDFIYLISNIHYFETIEDQDFSSYLQDWFDNHDELYIVKMEKKLFYELRSVSTALPLFQVEIAPHNQGYSSLTINDDQKIIAEMVKQENLDFINKVAAGASIMLEALQAYKTYVKETQKLKEVENDGRWVYLDLQDCNLILSHSERKWIQSILKRMANSKGFDYENLTKVNFKLSYKAWKNKNSVDDDDGEYI